MILTTKQALSFVDATSKGAPKHFFDALLGAGQTPKVEDFTCDDAERLDRAEEFLHCVQSVTDTLVDHLRNQPRQTSLFDKETAKAAKTMPVSHLCSLHDKPAKKKVMSNVFKPTDDEEPIHDKPAKKKPAKKKPAKKKIVTAMQKFKDSIGKPAKKKPAKKPKKKPAKKDRR